MIVARYMRNLWHGGKKDKILNHIGQKTDFQ